MSTRPHWPSSALLLSALLGLLPAAPPARGAEPAPAASPVRVELRARALEPGEVVRIVATPATVLDSLEGRFLDRDVFMAPGRHGTWSGWSLVPLDQTPGPAVVELSGRTASGGEVRGALAVTIAAKEFPTEQLTVAPRYVEPPAAVSERIARERKLLAEVYARRDERRPPAEPFVRPVPGEPTSAFGKRRIFNGQPRAPHGGLDLRAATGTPVVAAGPGTVALARDLYYAGGTVIVDHGGGLFTIYAHLSRLDVEPGQELQAGDRVGLSGATGRVTGPHLHWGAKIGSVPFDPRGLLDTGLFDGS
jgi:murein DD-endopeptidase MepM/ murein hydrolase activator NlpD